MIKRYNSSGQRLFKTIVIKIFPERALAFGLKERSRAKHVITRKYVSSANRGYNEENVNKILDEVASACEKEWPSAEFKLVELKTSRFVQFNFVWQENTNAPKYLTKLLALESEVALPSDEALNAEALSYNKIEKFLDEEEKKHENEL